MIPETTNGQNLDKLDFLGWYIVIGKVAPHWLLKFMVWLQLPYDTNSYKFILSLPPSNVNLGGISSFRRFKAVHVVWPTAALLLPTVPWKMTTLWCWWCWLVGCFFFKIFVKIHRKKLQQQPLKNGKSSRGHGWTTITWYKSSLQWCHVIRCHGGAISSATLW